MNTFGFDKGISVSVFYFLICLIIQKEHLEDVYDAKKKNVLDISQFSLIVSAVGVYSLHKQQNYFLL